MPAAPQPQPQTGPSAEADGAASPAPRPAMECLIGMPLALIDYEGTLDWMDAAADAGERAYVCVAPVHTVMQAQEDPDLRHAVLSSAFTVADGQPLVWALNALGHDLKDRVYGPELMARWCERAAATGRRAYLYGGKNQGTLVQLTLNLRQRYPGLRIVGGYAPPYRPLTEEEKASVAEEINRSQADVVWVGIGVPKQEKWMADMRARLHPPVLVGVGAAFDFHAGLMPQAPHLLQDLGMEWAFRLWHEPRRLWRRYARYNPRFVVGFGRQWARRQRARRQSPR